MSLIRTSQTNVTRRNFYSNEANAQRPNVLFKDIWTTETFTQVCVSGEYFGNIEVKAADGKVHVFDGKEGARPESVEIAHGFELDEGNGWVRVQKNTITKACDELNAILARNGLFVRR